MCACRGKGPTPLFAVWNSDRNGLSTYTSVRFDGPNRLLAIGFDGSLCLDIARGPMMVRFLVAACFCGFVWVGPAAAQTATSLSFEEAVDAAERTAESIVVARANVDRARAQV